MTPQLRSDYDRARHILVLFEQRRESYFSKRGHAMNLSRGPMTRHSTAIHDDPLEDWCNTVAWALTSYGRESAYILHARLFRRQKSAENSWEQIAREMNSTAAHVRSAFLPALIAFVAELDARGITPELKGQAMPLHDHRCAASERKQPCAA